MSETQAPKRAKKKTEATDEQKRASAERSARSLPSDTLAGGPTNADLNPAYAPLEDAGKVEEAKA